MVDQNSQQQGGTVPPYSPGWQPNPASSGWGQPASNLGMGPGQQPAWTAPPPSQFTAPVPPAQPVYTTSPGWAPDPNPEPRKRGGILPGLLIGSLIGMLIAALVGSVLALNYGDSKFRDGFAAGAGGVPGHFYSVDDVYFDEADGQWYVVTRVNAQGEILDEDPVDAECVVIIKGVGAAILENCEEQPPVKTPAPDDGKGHTGTCIGDATQAVHFARLIELDPHFRSGGWEAWMKAAGFTWEFVREARQPEEETYDPDWDGTGNDYVAGLQINATDVVVNWPNAVTTDTPSRITETDTTVKILAAQNTGSTVYTNVIANGPVTVYADATNWGQLASVLGCDNGTSGKPPAHDPDPTEKPTGDLCLSEEQLIERFGIARETIGDARNGILFDNGVRAGALLKLDKGNPARLNNRGWYVTGDRNAGYLPAWNPPSCRPMARN